jgi:hypothetical protein
MVSLHQYRRNKSKRGTVYDTVAYTVLALMFDQSFK